MTKNSTSPDSTLLWDSLDVEYPISLRVASNFDFLSYNWSRVGQVGKKCVRLRKFKKSCLQLPLKYVRMSTSRVYASPVSYAVESKYNNTPVDVSNAPNSAHASPIWFKMSILARCRYRPVDASLARCTSQDDVQVFIILVSTSSSVHVLSFTPARRR